MARPLLHTAIGAGLLLAWPAGGGALDAQPFPPEPPDESRRVAGWLVEHKAEEDGGRLVRMVRRRGGLRLSYHVAFWRGNGGPLSSARIEGPDGPCASRSWRRDQQGDVWRAEPDSAAAARDVRARLIDAIAECGPPPGRAEAALEGFERAFAFAFAFSETARRATLAEAEAIANYGREPEPAPDAPPPGASRPDRH